MSHYFLCEYMKPAQYILKKNLTLSFSTSKKKREVKVIGRNKHLTQPLSEKVNLLRR